jgi:alpha 1,6-mannosyltransferase
MAILRIRRCSTRLSILRRIRIFLFLSFLSLFTWLFLFYQSNSVSFETIQWHRIPVNVAHIPRQIIQTSKSSSDVDLTSNSFIRLNPTYKYFLYNDSAADEFVRQSMPDYIYQTYTSLPRPVLRADYFRYIFLLVEGGIYTDMDTVCLRPIDTWVDERTKKNVRLIVGIEADASLWDVWQGDYARQIQFVQWTIAAAPGHPILHEIVKRIAEISPDMARKADNINRILDWTGPAVWTDVISSYLWIKYGFKWQQLRNLEKPILFGEDIYILPITAFSPGLKKMGSKPVTDREARIQHLFSGSWKNLNKDNYVKSPTHL